MSGDHLFIDDEINIRTDSDADAALANMNDAQYLAPGEAIGDSQCRTAGRRPTKAVTGE